MQVFADNIPALQVNDFSAFILEKNTLLVFKYYTKILKLVYILDFWFRVIQGTSTKSKTVVLKDIRGNSQLIVKSKQYCSFLLSYFVIHLSKC